MQELKPGKAAILPLSRRPWATGSTHSTEIQPIAIPVSVVGAWLAGGWVYGWLNPWFFVFPGGKW